MRTTWTWPRDITTWVDHETLNISVPFTWLLPKAAQIAAQTSTLWRQVAVGGPAVDLQPHYFDPMPWVSNQHSSNGILQRINPHATRTTLGCPNRCPFCAVPKLEGPFQQLNDWPDLPVLIDSNLLAADDAHFDRVLDRLEQHQWVDFNQGLDARRLNDHHAERLHRLHNCTIRLALDNEQLKPTWSRAFDLLRAHAIPKSSVRSYALIGFDTGPSEAWTRCQWIESHGTKALPMWFHPLDALKANAVTDEQQRLGWTDYERRRIMQWYYQHKKAVK